MKLSIGIAFGDINTVASKRHNILNNANIRLAVFLFSVNEHSSATM